MSETKIKVREISTDPSWRFDVVAEECDDQTEYLVSMGKDFYKSLDTKVEPWKVIEATFRFLLEREPKESILREFDITVVSHYFPEFKKELVSVFFDATVDEQISQEAEEYL